MQFPALIERDRVCGPEAAGILFKVTNNGHVDTP